MKMCAFTKENKNSLCTGGGKSIVVVKAETGQSRGLWTLFYALGIIITAIQLQRSPLPCQALVMMETPTPPMQQTNDNLAAATEYNNNSTYLTYPNRTTTTTISNNATNNVSPNSLLGRAQQKFLATNSLPAPSSAPQRMPPPRVLLNKCCHFGEYLDKTKTCVAGASDKWIPLIYLINRKDHFRPQGSSPKFITFQDNIFPISQARSDDDDNNDNSPDTVDCTVEDLVLFTGTDKFVIFSNGSLFLSERSVLMPPSRYCVDQQAALVCLPKPKHPEPLLKLKKCCGPHGIYDNQQKTCHFNASRNNILDLQLPENITYQTIYGFPECHEDSVKYAIAGDWSGSPLLSHTTGHLHLPNHQLNLSSSDYCLEKLRSNNETSPNEAVKVFACLHHFGVEKNDISSSNRRQIAALSFGLVISVIFLAATLVASYLMPSIHHVLHWRCQIYYVFCLFIGDFLLAFSQLFKPLILEVALCQIVASTMHFFFLAAFFWLNTMCFNIWWTFRDFRPSSLERNQELIRLRLYSAYAWGIPIIIAAIAACVNLVPDSPLLRPGFGEHSCWFNAEHLPIFAYFYGPVGILLSINIMLFISTTHQLTCGLWKRDDVKSTTEKTALGKVCLKLVVVMGVTWIVDVLSWIIGGPDSAWFVTDLVNALQGVFIFLVVGCQPQVWSACRRFCCPRSRQEITNTTNGVQHSSSSQGLPSMGACGGEITQNTSVHHNTTIGSNAGSIVAATGGSGRAGDGGGGVGVGNHTPATTAKMKIPMETVC
ncbi:probable G-protein coupled receptor Mth-like 1 [Stomoxys calcitrans]|uniref:G-protein coupled receptors family 2 profile 2 domain-containing protein n=1 Tax=Stomoxys calcitrans TaxID=35570 RepID=A0A1I8QE85_STOCA|nr:probable G-protein coupled receptor Mth-like 1 [Stomoxys calcitrans]